MKNKKQYTVRDLRKWLKDNGHQEGYDDIGKMMLDKKYAKQVHYKVVDLKLSSSSHLFIKDVLLWLFHWDFTDLGYDYWGDIWTKMGLEGEEIEKLYKK